MSSPSPVQQFVKDLHHWRVGCFLSVDVWQNCRRTSPFFIRVVLVLLWICANPGCRNDSAETDIWGDVARSASERKPRIVATTGMVADLVRHVGGAQVQVISLMGEGIDPHLYRPTSHDIARLMQADLIFYSGLNLEGPMEAAFRHARRRKRLVVAVADGIPSDKILYPDGRQAHPDPHVWGDLQLWSDCLQTVCDELCRFDPSHADEYTENARNYAVKLAELHAYATLAIASIPEQQRVLVTAHDAFEYFARAYGIEVRSIQGISTESEPGVRDINNLVDFLVQRKIPAVFVEATINPRIMRAVTEGAQKQGWTVDVGGTLYSDSLGKPGTYAGTFVGMFETNVNQIVRSLGGDLPPGGFSGRLDSPTGLPEE